MDKNKHITDEEWSAIARNFYEGDSVQLPADQESEESRAEIEKTARKIDLYFRLKKFDAATAFRDLRKRALVTDASNRKQVAGAPDIQGPQDKKSGTIMFLKKKSILKIAAVAVFALIVAGAGFLVGSRQNEVQQPAGVIVDQYGNSRIKLADGSIVTLNHDSKINYPDKFRDDIREVSIEGEGFFEVWPDPSRPFVIHAGKATIKVLGTSFNVNAYPQNENVEVVVEEGKVRVTKSSDTAGVSGEMILDPGDRGVLSGFNGEMKKTRNNNPNFLSWKTREFMFDKTSLKEVMIQLNKVYQTEVKATDPQLERLLLSARFEDRSLDFILKVISMTHDLKVEQRDNQYILKRDF
jgi:ferric-dicitrate binding protein FerR (iron transport regulator)